jgi:hypothetical protein
MNPSKKIIDVFIFPFKLEISKLKTNWVSTEESYICQASKAFTIQLPKTYILIF